MNWKHCLVAVISAWIGFNILLVFAIIAMHALSERKRKREGFPHDGSDVADTDFWADRLDDLGREAQIDASRKRTMLDLGLRIPGK